MKPILRILFIALLFSNLWADTLPLTWYTKDATGKPILNIELFMASTCPHCHKEDAFLKDIEASYPWINVHRHIINEDRASLTLFSQLLAEQKMTDFAVPSTFICNSRWTGFGSAKTTGQDLLKAMTDCKEAIEKEGSLSLNTVNILRQQAIANKGAEVISPFAALKTIFIVALLDVITPCSFFIPLAFFGILLMQETRKAQILFGLLFILTVGITHAFQQIFMTTYFTILPWLLVPAVAIGLFSIYVVRQAYQKKTKGVLFLFETVFLALMVVLYQQSCFKNLSYLYEQWLHHQNFLRHQIILYEFVYQLIYILPFAVILFLYSFLIGLKRLRPFKKPLHTLGLVFIGLIGLVLVIFPRALSSVFLSFITFFVAIVGAWILTRRMKKADG